MDGVIDVTLHYIFGTKSTQVQKDPKQRITYIPLYSILEWDITDLQQKPKLNIQNRTRSRMN